MDIIAVDDPGQARTQEWHSVVAAAVEYDRPGEPVPDLEQTAARLRVAKLASRQLTWAAVDSGGRMTGVASLRVPDDPLRAGEIDIQIRPEHRRSGVGTRLLAVAAAALRSGPCSMVVAQVHAGTPAVPFLEARGFRCVLTLKDLRLTIDEVDRSRLARMVAEGRSGYRLVRWTGTVPEELAAELATAKMSMAEVPVGDLAYEPFRWDAERVREMAEVVAKRGDDLYTVAAVHGPSVAPQVAGFTEIVIPGTGADRAAQYDTVVVPGHRGRRLGIWLKAAMLEWIITERPEIREIETDNADDNTYMLAVNEELGFRDHHEYLEFQADIADLP